MVECGVYIGCVRRWLSGSFGRSGGRSGGLRGGLRGFRAGLFAAVFLAATTMYLVSPTDVFPLDAVGVTEVAAGADEYAVARALMVSRDLKGRGITDEKVLEVMAKVPRHLFVGQRMKAMAYRDHPLPIAEGQTISQPYVVALMTELLGLKSTARVLEVGTGSGYQAAVLAGITDRVYTIEIRQGLAREAGERLERLGYGRVEVKHADGYYGWEEHAPFDAIIVTAAANHIPPPLLKQLKVGGRLIIPLGSTTYYQTLTVVTKVKGAPESDFDVEQISGVRFVPMVGRVREGKGH